MTSRSNQTLEDLAKLIDPVARGWLNYYGRYYRSECVNVLRHVNMVLTRWVMGKYKGSSAGKLRPYTG
ncbi:group II intron maturase-specific domain-containing protein [Bradyrhizobium sp. CCGUVB23]|uniref:group II intron maturase-specific domain-containing protein n=1 Tax=Bradyrhizobium sp. CCGUVB23 TaxID=2949630 RepID=UPI0035318E8A